jgi:hypothetical protein
MSKKSITIIGAIAILIVIIIAISIAISKTNIKTAAVKPTSKSVALTLASLNDKDTKTAVLSQDVAELKTVKDNSLPRLDDTLLSNLNLGGNKVAQRLGNLDKVTLVDAALLLKDDGRQLDELSVLNLNADKLADPLGVDNLPVAKLNLNPDRATLGLGLQLNSGLELDNGLLSVLKLNDDKSLALDTLGLQGQTLNNVA